MRVDIQGHPLTAFLVTNKIIIRLLIQIMWLIISVMIALSAIIPMPGFHPHLTTTKPNFHWRAPMRCYLVLTAMPVVIAERPQTAFPAISRIITIPPIQITRRQDSQLLAKIVIIRLSGIRPPGITIHSISQFTLEGIRANGMSALIVMWIRITFRFSSASSATNIVNRRWI